MIVKRVGVLELRQAVLEAFCPFWLTIKKEEKYWCCGQAETGFLRNAEFKFLLFAQ